MVPSRFSGLIALSLTVVFWFGMIAPIAAQPAPSPASTVAPTVVAPTVEIAMASKPLFSFSGKRPANLGIQSGKLAVCPNSPNCVSSQATTGDSEHHIAPIAYKSAPSEVITKLKSVLESMERTQVITETGDYLYVEFTSALMGFVDDVEFYVDPSTPGQLQVRSASRLGQSDLGVNRKRVEEIRAKLATAEA